MTIHAFSSTGTAYDHSQCDDAVERGDTLLVQSEGVVGLAWTWPVAVTEATGKLHGVEDNLTAEQMAELIADTGWRFDQIKEAVKVAVDYGFELADWAKEYV